jgi:hypothetical protein
VAVAQVVMQLLVLEIQKIPVVLVAHEPQMIAEVEVVVLLDILELVVLEGKAQLLLLLEPVAVVVVAFGRRQMMLVLVAVFNFMELVQMDLLELLALTTMQELVG